MRKLVGVLPLAALIFAATSVQADDPFAQWTERYKRDTSGAASSLRVSATSTFVAGEPALHFSVTNTSSAPLSIATASLPWGNAYSINLLGLSSSGALRPRYPVDDLGVGHVVLQPGATLEGNYVLNQVLQGPRQALKASDLIVVWSYGTTSGVVVLQKR